MHQEGIEARESHKLEEELQAVAGEFDVREAHAAETLDRMNQSRNPFTRFFARFRYHGDQRRLARLGEQSQSLEYRLHMLKIEE